MKRLLIAAAALVVLSTQAMAVDLKMTFKDPETGKALPDILAPDDQKKAEHCDGQEGPCLTLGAVLFHSLLRGYPDEQQKMEADKMTELKFRRGALAYRILGRDAADLTPDEVKLARDAVGRLYSPSVVYQVFTAIDPKSEDKK